MLSVLVLNANRLVAKEVLFEAVWRGVRVTDDSLVQCIHELRAALGDTTQRLIRNVPRRGYLLASEVTPEETLPRAGPAGVRVDAVDPHPPGAPSPAGVGVRRARLRVAAAALMGLVAVVVAVTWWRSAPPHPAVRTAALAVFPFRPLGPPSEEDEILGLGIADALILKLSAVTRLTVRPTSAVVGVPRDRDVLESGRKLGVDYVLEGHLQRSGATLRVTAQLLSVESGASLWSDRFQVESADLFRVQDVIAESAAVSLLQRLSKDERQRAGAPRHDRPRGEPGLPAGARPLGAPDRGCARGERRSVPASPSARPPLRTGRSGTRRRVQPARRVRIDPAAGVLGARAGCGETGAGHR